MKEERKQESAVCAGHLYAMLQPLGEQNGHLTVQDTENGCVAMYPAALPRLLGQKWGRARATMGKHDLTMEKAR